MRLSFRKVIVHTASLACFAIIAAVIVGSLYYAFMEYVGREINRNPWGTR